MPQCLTKISREETTAFCTRAREFARLLSVLEAAFRSPEVDAVVVTFLTDSIAFSMAAVSLAPFSITSSTYGSKVSTRGLWEQTTREMVYIKKETFLLL